MPEVRGILFNSSSKTGGVVSKASKTSLGAHLTRFADSHLEEKVAIEVGMSADGDFEILLRVGKQPRGRTLAKGNVRRIATEIRRAEARSKEEQL
jgi:hypothetical protein